MKLTIPVPPSKNDAYAEQAVAKKGPLIAAVTALMRNEKGAWTKVKRAMNVIRRRSDAYLAYLDELDRVLSAQKTQILEGDVEMSVTVFFPDRRRDAPNIIDVLLDSLEGRCYGNDRQVTKFCLTREIDGEDPRCVVTVRSLNLDLFAEPDPEDEFKLSDVDLEF